MGTWSMGAGARFERQGSSGKCHAAWLSMAIALLHPLPGLTRPVFSASSPSSLPIPRARLLSRFASSTFSAPCFLAAERLRCVKAVFRTLGRGYSLLSCIYPYILTFFFFFYEHAFWHYTFAVDASALFHFTLLSLQESRHLHLPLLALRYISLGTIHTSRPFGSFNFEQHKR